MPIVDSEVGMSDRPTDEPRHHVTEFCEDWGGWHGVVCACGWESGEVYPSREDAVDALTDHIREVSSS